MRARPRSFTAAVVAIVAAALVSVAGLPAAGAKTTRDIVVKPNPVDRGEKITIKGKGWPKRKQVQLLIGRPRSEAFPLGTKRANRKGRFKKRFEADLPDGRWVIVACKGKACKGKKRDSFRVRER